MTQDRSLTTHATSKASSITSTPGLDATLEKLLQMLGTRLRTDELVSLLQKELALVAKTHEAQAEMFRILDGIATVLHNHQYRSMQRHGGRDNRIEARQYYTLITYVTLYQRCHNGSPMSATWWQQYDVALLAARDDFCALVSEPKRHSFLLESSIARKLSDAAPHAVASLIPAVMPQRSTPRWRRLITAQRRIKAP